MNCTLLRFGGCAILLAGLIASPGRADLISGSVSFDPGLSTTKVYANGGVDPDDKAPGIAFKNWSDYDFSHQSLPAKGQFAGSLDVFGLEKGETAHFSAHGQGTPFSLTFEIHDGSNTGAVTFTGLLDGILKKDPHGNETSSVRIDWLGPTTKSLDIDHHLYTLSVSDFLQKGAFPDTKALGSFHVEVQVSHNPEPASLVLAAIGVVPLGLTWLRRKRRTPAG
jgi:hypothetical protein